MTFLSNPGKFRSDDDSPDRLPLSGVVVFDGVCNLCSHTVQFILAHEKAASLKFASVQSAAGSRIMLDCGLDPGDAKTFVLVEEGRAYFRSEAAVRIATHLRAPWRWLGVVGIVPSFLRDWIYDLVARNRYRWFGRRDACMVPSAAIASRFLSE
jgi:predicted DCC family thiol-disulfide oxidoreductase YuxK